MVTPRSLEPLLSKWKLIITTVFQTCHKTLTQIGNMEIFKKFSWIAEDKVLYFYAINIIFWKFTTRFNVKKIDVKIILYLTMKT